LRTEDTIVDVLPGPEPQRSAVSRAAVGSAALAFFGLCCFIPIVYANPGNWFDGWDAVPFAKIAAGASLAALGGSWLLYNRRLTIGGVQGWALLLLFGLVGMSASWSVWPKFTVDTFLDGLKYLAIFVLIVNTVDSESRLATVVRVIALASAIPAFGAIWSHAHGEHLVEGDRAGWIGIFGNPNDLAYHLVVGVALILAAAQSAKTLPRKLAWYSLLAPVAYGILLTQSRGGMFATCVVVALWLLRSVKRAPLIVGVAVTVGVILFMSPNNPWRTRTQEATAYGVDESAKGRIDAWRTGMNIAKERPMTGVGAGAFMIAWPEYAPGDAGMVRSEHNTFVQLIAELGIPALLLFLVALAGGALGVSRAGKSKTPLAPYARGVQCGLAGFAVCSIWGGIAWTWPVYLLLGLAFVTRRLADAQPQAVVQTHNKIVHPHNYAPTTPVAALGGRV
jgi:putative inorganic carbon (hco3(-)) transporter